MKNKKSTIPLKLREKLGNDPEYGYCALTGERGTHDDPIEWHHNLRFAGSNVQERFCILPLLQSVHKQADNIIMREKLDHIMLGRDTENKLVTEYSKAVNWAQRKIYLEEKLGPYTPVKPLPRRKELPEPPKSNGIELTRQEWAIVYRTKEKLREIHPEAKLTPREVLNHMILSFSD